MKNAFGLLLISFLFSSGLFAQSSEFGTDTVQIESSRIGLTSGQTGRFVTVISKAQISSLPARSLDELLRFIPGVEVQARGAFGTQADISMRGGTFNQVLVLMDGMRINDPLTGHFQSYLPVLPEEIERIEVLRGPASAQFGPDAVGGVINIVTKTFTNSQEKGSYARLSGDLGQHNTLGGSGIISHNSTKVRGNIGGRYLKSDGHPLPSGEQADFNMNSVSGSLGIDLSNGWDLALRSGWDQRTFQAQYFYTVSTFDESREQTGRWWNQARLTKRTNKGETRFDITYLASSDSFLFNPAFSANVHTMGLLNGNLHHTRVINQSLSVGAGIQASNRWIESNDRGNHADAHAGAYVMAYVTPVEDLHLNGSLRVDLDENYGSEVTPQVNISYIKPSVTLRAGLGKAIRAADYTERFVSTEIPGPLSPGRNLGNPNLLAESSWSYEAGADITLSESIRASITGFYRQGSNLIDYLLTNYESIPAKESLTPGGDYLYASNLSTLNTLGLELFVTYDKQISSQSYLHLDAGYTAIQHSDATPASKYLSNTAKNQVSLRGNWRYRDLSIGVQGLWRERNEESAAAIGATLEPTFMIWHTQAQYSFLNDRLKLSGSLFNMFDEQYADLLGAQMPGRWWALGVTIVL